MDYFFPIFRLSFCFCECVHVCAYGQRTTWGSVVSSGQSSGCQVRQQVPFPAASSHRLLPTFLLELKHALDSFILHTIKQQGSDFLYLPLWLPVLIYQQSDFSHQNLGYFLCYTCQCLVILASLEHTHLFPTPLSLT